MKKCILLITVFILLPIAAMAELSGTSYKTKYGIVCLGGPGTSSGTYGLKNIIGANIGTMSSSTYTLVAGGLTILEEAVVVAEAGFVVTGLEALTSPGGGKIDQSSWQKDNDPYFFWESPAEGVQVLGYSYSLDTPPNDEIDTSNRYYNFPQDSITDGAHTFYVKAERTSGLWGDPATFNIWVDTTAPRVNNLAPTLGGMFSTDTPEVGATISDAASGVDAETIEVRINQARVSPEYNSESGRVTFIPSIPLSDGEITVSLAAGDIAGNDALSLTWSFIIDTEGPTGSILINNGDEMTTTNVVTLNISAQDAVTNVVEMMLSYDGIFDTESWEAYTSLRKNWVLPAINGVRKVYAKLKDEAGNISEAFFDSINLVIVAPETYILSGPSGVRQSQSAQFTFRGSFSDCQFSYKFDNEDWSDWTSDASASKAELSEGNHYFMVRAAKDLNGDSLLQLDEVDPTPILRVWTISTTGVLQPPIQPERPIKRWEEE